MHVRRESCKVMIKVKKKYKDNDKNWRDGEEKAGRLS